MLNRMFDVVKGLVDFLGEFIWKLFCIAIPAACGLLVRFYYRKWCGNTLARNLNAVANADGLAAVEVLLGALAEAGVIEVLEV